MGSPSVFVLHGIQTATTFYSQLDDASPTPGVSAILGTPSGHFEPLFRGIKGLKPDVPFKTSQVATLLGQCGIYGASLAAANTDLWYRKVAAYGTRDSGSTHTRLRMANSFLYWKSISARVNGDAVADCAVSPVFDGTNAPIVATGSVALSGTPTAAEYFSLGPVSLNGSVLEGAEDVSIDLGVTLWMKGNAAYPSFLAIREINPVVTIKGLDLGPWATLGTVGYPLSALTVYLRKCNADATGGLPYVADATAQHIKFTAATGLVMIDNTSGGGTSEAVTGLRILLRSADSTHAPLTISAASAIT